MNKTVFHSNRYEDLADAIRELLPMVRDELIEEGKATSTVESTLSVLKAWGAGFGELSYPPSKLDYYTSRSTSWWAMFMRGYKLLAPMLVERGHDVPTPEALRDTRRGARRSARKYSEASSEERDMIFRGMVYDLCLFYAIHKERREEFHPIPYPMPFNDLSRMRWEHVQRDPLITAARMTRMSWNDSATRDRSNVIYYRHVKLAHLGNEVHQAKLEELRAVPYVSDILLTEYTNNITRATCTRYSYRLEDMIWTCDSFDCATHGKKGILLFPLFEVTKGTYGVFLTQQALHLDQLLRRFYTRFMRIKGREPENDDYVLIDESGKVVDGAAIYRMSRYGKYNGSFVDETHRLQEEHELLEGYRRFQQEFRIDYDAPDGYVYEGDLPLRVVREKSDEAFVDLTDGYFMV